MKLNRHIHPLLACAIIIIAFLLISLYDETRGQWECVHTHIETTGNVSSGCDGPEEKFIDETCMHYCVVDRKNKTECENQFCTKYHNTDFVHQNIDLNTAVTDFNSCKNIKGNFTLDFIRVDVCDKKTRVKT